MISCSFMHIKASPVTFLLDYYINSTEQTKGAPSALFTEASGSKFFDADPPFSAKDTLRAWQDKNHPWLELSDVHRETTEGVRVTVIPFYMGCRVAQSSTVYWVSPAGIPVFSQTAQKTQKVVFVQP